MDPQADDTEQVVLVDAHDHIVGHMEKMAAHRAGMLHRAFSVFVFGHSGELLLQQRALSKYHSPGLWSNSCCGHPRPGELLSAAAQRRLAEELGLVCTLTPAFSFHYRIELGGGLIENEIDHVFIGLNDRTPRPDPLEVAVCRWISRGALVDEMERTPEAFSAWLPLCVHQAWDAYEFQGRA